MRLYACIVYTAEVQWWRCQAVILTQSLNHESLTAVNTRFNNNTISKNETDSQVINTLLPIKQASKYVSKKHL